MGISIWQLLIVFAIIILLFGTKKLRNLGGDLGSAVKGFKNAVKDEDNSKDAEFKTPIDDNSDNNTTTTTKQSETNKSE